MISHDSWGVIGCILFYIVTKFLCILADSFTFPMSKKRQHLTSIPERNESEDEIKVSKQWVPKKKHEVLKAKYKCLKKLFQIYDASVIGILPESYEQQQSENYNHSNPDEGRKHTRRKKRSYRTKTDACAGTTEVSSGDVTQFSEDKGSVSSAVIRDLKIQCSCSTQMMTEKSTKCEGLDYKASSMATDNFGCNTIISTEHPPMERSLPHPIPYLIVNERRPTRFQSFIQRLFGIRRERGYHYMMQGGRVYAASDNNIAQNYGEKRRRRGLRFRRLRKSKKVIHSEIQLRDLSSPTILSYLQSIQKNCLMDRTPRQCPILGCKMLFYGIINYNDHLNLCHFIERRYICHYCHEGFEGEYDKYVHENEHLGISKIKPNMQNVSATSTLRRSQKSSDTQTDPELSKTDVPEDKLKKIVSFFDKIVDTEQMLTELKKNRYSESNLQTLQQSSKTEIDTMTETDTSASSDKRTVSCGNLLHRKTAKNKQETAPSDMTSKYACSPVKCHICGEDFDYRRQLSLHVDLEHGGHDKFSKFHSCAGIVNQPYCQRSNGTVQSETGKIKIRSASRVNRAPSTTLTQDTYSEVSREKSEGTLSCDPSTNIIYYESKASIKKPSAIDNFVGKVRSGITSYRWEPGTKIIRV